MTWEYMTVREMSEAALQTKLDECGKDGWEAFAVSSKKLDGGSEILRAWLKRGTETRADALRAKALHR